MAKCPELFHKFKTYSESCGIGNPKDMERHISIAEGISEDYGIHVDKVYLLFPMTASRKLAKYPKENSIRKNVTRKIADAITNNVRVTTKTVEIWLHDEGVPLKFTTVSPAKIAKRVDLPADIVAGTQFQPVDNLSRVPIVQSIKPVVPAGDIKLKISSLKSALTPGQIAILNEIMVKYGHDDELGALSLALIWAKERMQNE